jgi:hypothetical protein
VKAATATATMVSSPRAAFSAQAGQRNVLGTQEGAAIDRGDRRGPRRIQRVEFGVEIPHGLYGDQVSLGASNIGRRRLLTDSGWVGPSVCGMLETVGSESPLAKFAVREVDVAIQ